MRKATSLLWGAAALAAVALVSTSCNTRERLARQIEGTWSGSPHDIMDTGADQATLTPVVDIQLTVPDATTGTVTLTGMISVVNTTPFNDSITTPLQITASGTATITGSFQVRDDDEVTVLLDPTSLSVAVDPSDVVLEYNILTDAPASALDKLRPAAAVLVRQQMTRTAQRAFSGLSKVDDVEVHDDVLTCEVGHQDFSLSRVKEP